MTAIATERQSLSTGSPKKWMTWTGRALSALPVLALTLSASMKLTHAPQFVDTFVSHFGFRESSLTAIGILELACVALYLVPRTAILGGILVAAYLGGAVATHVRVGEPFILPVLLGVFAWLGLYFRDTRVRALVPLRQPG